VVDVLDAADFFGTGLYDAGNYNTPPGTESIAAVPEPAVWTAVMTGLAALAMASSRHRTRGSNR
jgi:hypothetical protein